MSFAAALHEFKRKLFCAIHFAGEGHIPDHAVHSTMRSQIQRIRCPSTWWPPFSPCTSSALTIVEHFEADAWERFRIQLQRHRLRSNLSAIDRLGLHWLRENNYGVSKDDKGTALIPMMSSYLHGLKQQACSNTVQFGQHWHSFINRLTLNGS